LLGRYRTFLRATTAFAPLQPTFPRTNSPVAPNIEGGVEQLHSARLYLILNTAVCVMSATGFRGLLHDVTRPGHRLDTPIFRASIAAFGLPAALTGAYERMT